MARRSPPLNQEMSVRRLRQVLGALFVALALPTAVLTWQAYDQLKFEAFYQFQGQAKALADRIDAELVSDVAAIESRRFTDFAFLNVAGDVSNNVLQRSPLSAFPVAADVPGGLGYFQVDAAGTFSTPLLPEDGAAAGLGVTQAELSERSDLALSIRQVLVDNRLLRQHEGRIPAAKLPEPADAPQPGLSSPRADLEISTVSEVDETADDSREQGLGAAASASPNEASPATEDEDSAYGQAAFDRLNSSLRRAEPEPQKKDKLAPPQSAPSEYNVTKLRDISLDDELQKKSESRERQAEEEAQAEPKRASSGDGNAARARRVEQVVLPESLDLESAETATGGRSVAPITAFESEIDPFQFSLLDSGHLVLFRNVWRDEQRYVQGLLIDRDEFLTDTISSAFAATTLSSMSELIIASGDDVLDIVRGVQSREYRPGASELQSNLLHRASLSPPFGNLQLIFSIRQLPPGPGGRVLAWTTIVLAIVFIVGFIALYRLGNSQIRLARQQQDFVSAVSHELKTPLTSIRMYGEMLKEGWVDDARRRQYYDYIHDESERLTRLISNVLRLARISRSDPQFDLQPHTVREIMNQVESKISSQVERAGFTLRMLRQQQADPVTVHVDADCFTQIVINLVDNAIKFSRDATDKTIEVSSSLGPDGAVLFTVRDFGPGVAQDQMKKIFTLFYRSESELTRETVGTGIGLAIVHQLTLAMDGTVDVMNRDPGAEFRLSFPRKD